MISGERERALGALRQNLDIMKLRAGSQSRPLAPLFPQTVGGRQIRPIDLAPVDEGSYSVHLLPMGSRLLYVTHRLPASAERVRPETSKVFNILRG